MKSIDSRDYFIPIRLGTVLRMIREGNLNVSLRSLNGKIKEAITEDDLKITTATWSAYEVGNRIVSEVGALDLVQDILVLLKNLTNNQIGDKDIASLHSFYFRESFLTGLSEIFPLRYAATRILAEYISGSGQIIEAEKNHMESEISDSEVTAELLKSWLTKDKAFQQLFAKWLVRNNRFASRKINGVSNLSIEKSEQAFRKLRPKNYTSFYDPTHFCSVALEEGLFFEHHGSALDTIMAFSKGMSISEDFSELKINVVNQDKPISIRSYWFENIRL